MAPLSKACGARVPEPRLRRGLTTPCACWTLDDVAGGPPESVAGRPRRTARPGALVHTRRRCRSCRATASLAQLDLLRARPMWCIAGSFAFKRVVERRPMQLWRFCSCRTVARHSPRKVAPVIPASSEVVQTLPDMCSGRRASTQLRPTRPVGVERHVWFLRGPSSAK